MELMLELGDGYSAMAAIESLSEDDLSRDQRRTAMAHAFILQGKPENAVTLFDGTAPEQLSEREAYLRLWALSELDDMERLEPGMDLALETYPDSAPLNALAAHKLVELGLPEEAMSFAQKALAADPKHYETRIVLGEIALREGEPEKALASYIEASRIKPEQPTPLAVIAGIQLDLERYEEAGQTIDRAMKQHPEMPFLVWQKARHALATGDLETARRTGEEARRTFRGNDEFTLFSAQLEEALGNRILALAEYRRYLRAVGEDPDISARIAALEGQAGG
ncbi:MAG: tetratricopeptide repeat protein [Erythrobacter sp.]|nr:tetratricopeptide repeat protein [Erythrobacter sp.]